MSRVADAVLRSAKSGKWRAHSWQRCEGTQPPTTGHELGDTLPRVEFGADLTLVDFLDACRTALTLSHALTLSLIYERQGLGLSIIFNQLFIL